jgi:hypothetical protein
MWGISIKLKDCEYDERMSAIRFFADIDGIFEHGTVPLGDVLSVAGGHVRPENYEEAFRKAVASGKISLTAYRTIAWTPWSIDGPSRVR